jgi:hypothetical protein
MGCSRSCRLFPFKDADGKPIIKELKVHGLKVVTSIGDLLDKLSNFASCARWVPSTTEVVCAIHVSPTPPYNMCGCTGGHWQDLVRVIMTSLV